MRIGVVLPLFSGDPDKVLAAARETEALGYDGAFVFDHFFPPGAAPDRPSLEAFTTLAAVAAVTERIRVGTLVTRASLRPPGILAKQASWIDAISGGRLILGIGTGDETDADEHRAFGLPLMGRGERRAHLLETVRALRSMFEGEGYSGGERVPPLSGPLVPAAAPPIWVAGLADPVVRLAAREADGWNGWGLDAPAFARKAALLRAEAGDRTVEATWAGIVLVGRDDAELAELKARRADRGMEDASWSGTAVELAGFLTQLGREGAGWGILVAAGPRDRRELIAREVLPQL
ncbi:MAG TPA: LLM class flavin-dependent oxidoreductase [Actinomycetota bacterium]